jgi:hypothetical protein
MSMAATPVSDTLVLVATSPAPEIWLGEHAGHLVQQEVGALRSGLLPGHDVVACGLGTSPDPSHRTPASRDVPTELDAGPPCSRPVPSVRRNREARRERTMLRGLGDAHICPPNQRVEPTRSPARLRPGVCAEHVAQLGGESPLPSWMEAKG